MDIRERIIRKTAIYFKENTLDDLCLFMENILDYQRICYRESLKTLKRAAEDIQFNFRIYLDDRTVDERIGNESLKIEKMIRDEILADFEDKLNKEKFMENTHPGLQFQLIYVLDNIVREELDKICKE